MAELEGEIRASDIDAILRRYSRDGVYLVSYGHKSLVSHEDLVASFHEGWVEPASFQFDDLSFEVLGADAVAVAGIFRWKWSEEEGYLGSNASLLVREDGDLRIRLESESITNLDPSAWCPDEGGCEVPLESTELDRYVGEYDRGSLRFRVFEDSGRLRIDGPFRVPSAKMLYLGDHTFRLEAVPDVRIVFGGTGDRESNRFSSFTVFRDVFLGRPNRVDSGASMRRSGVVEVVPPTGVREADRASILAALDARAQDSEVPRTRTLPGIEDAAFPYAQPEDVGLSSEKLDRLGEEITEWVANGDLVGAELLIIKEGKAVFHEAYGWSDREARKPVERNSIWSIKSMSKPVTATAVLMLAERGKLSLDDPVSLYVPGFAGDKRTTIRHLLAQTSGYGGGPDGGGYDVYYFDSLREWVEDMAGHQPLGTVGEFRYSNFNYAVLGYIVEAVSGVPVETLTEERILSPLGMDETYPAFSPDAPWAERVPSRFRWNSEAGDFERHWSNRDPQPWVFYPAAFGLWGTAMDYAAFLSMWLRGGRHDGVRLLSEKTVSEALRLHGEVGEEGVYGYGWFVEAADANGPPLALWHGGADGTVAVAFPADDAIVVYLSHSGGTGSLRSRLGMLELFDTPGPYMVWADEHGVAEVALGPEDRARFLGTYRGKTSWAEDLDFVVRVWEEDRLLHMSFGPFGRMADDRVHLVPLGRDRFAPGRYGEEGLEAVDPHLIVQFTIKEGKARAVKAVAGDKIEFTAELVDPEDLRAEVEAERNRVSIAEIIEAVLASEGAEAVRDRHRALLSARPDSVRFAASYLDVLGHRLLRERRVKDAIAILEANVEAYPEVPVTYGSLGEAYLAGGRLEEARENFRRAAALSGEQADLDWRMYWRKYRAHADSLTQRLEQR
ncbi:MAG TPA: serine hydrolase [Gemmatimonadota bacterium]|nr:serine hydrolase [Gemmatimonadota bacterium]